jgi:protocatechuate 3,4-dioxygenase beta subunit/polyisoprenoid-binding protein YceI
MYSPSLLTRPVRVFAITLALLFSACGKAPQAAPPATRPDRLPTSAGLVAEPTPFRCWDGTLTPVEAGSTVQAGPSNGLPPTPAQGEPLVIEAAVFGDDCTPLAGARVKLYQTDSEGVYGPNFEAGADQIECCYLEANLMTGANGRFRLETVRPGNYKDSVPPTMAHIHLEVTHPQAQMLGSEIVFADDPHVDPNASTHGLVVVLPQPGEVESSPAKVARAELVLTRTHPPVATEPASSAATPEPPSGLLAVGEAHTFRLLPGESRAYYVIREQFAKLIDMTVAEAVTRGVEGELRLRLEPTPHLEAIHIQADLRGLVSDEPDRDEKLPRQWLETERYPSAEFSAEEVPLSTQAYTEGQELAFSLPGQLTIREQTRPVVFEVTATLEEGQIRGEAMATIRMSDFGIDPPNLLGFVTVEDEVMVRVELVAG